MKSICHAAGGRRKRRASSLQLITNSVCEIKKKRKKINCLLRHQLDHKERCVCERDNWCVCICTVGLSSVNAIIEREKVCVETVSGKVGCLFSSCWVPGVVACWVQARGQDVFSWTRPVRDLKPAHIEGAGRLQLTEGTNGSDCQKSDYFCNDIIEWAKGYFSLVLCCKVRRGRVCFPERHSDAVTFTSSPTLASLSSTVKCFIYYRAAILT